MPYMKGFEVKKVYQAECVFCHYVITCREYKNLLYRLWEHRTVFGHSAVKSKKKGKAGGTRPY